MKGAIAAFAALTRAADVKRAAGDARSRGQVMADLLVERLTGQAAAADVAITLDLVVSDTTLVGAGNEPATVPGWGPVPAHAAREWVADALDRQCPVWLRTIYANPAGRLVAMTSRQRFAPDGLADFLRIRDQGICRTPWCDAPVRHVDHVTAFADGGHTDSEGLQGLCEACNHAKQAVGWRQHVPTGQRRHTVETTTPTGHTYRSRAPAPPAPHEPAATSSRLEVHLVELLLQYAS